MVVEEEGAGREIVVRRGEGNGGMAREHATNDGGPLGRLTASKSGLKDGRGA